MTRLPFGAAFERFATRHLVTILGALFLLDLAIPDPLPFIDEAVLAVATLLLGRWRARRMAREVEVVGADPAEAGESRREGSVD
ncbi:MAG: DUF6116 family protein [Acidobacteriota bacterium]